MREISGEKMQHCYKHLGSFGALPETFVCMFAVFHELQSVVRDFEFDKIFCSTHSHNFQMGLIKSF